MFFDETQEKALNSDPASSVSKRMEPEELDYLLEMRGEPLPLEQNQRPADREALESLEPPVSDNYVGDLYGVRTGVSPGERWEYSLRLQSGQGEGRAFSEWNYAYSNTSDTQEVRALTALGRTVDLKRFEMTKDGLQQLLEDSGADISVSGTGINPDEEDPLTYYMETEFSAGDNQTGFVSRLRNSDDFVALGVSPEEVSKRYVDLEAWGVQKERISGLEY